MSKNYTIEDVRNLYTEVLNNIADKVVLNYKFGIDKKIDLLKFVRIKGLLPIINSNCDSNYKLINKLMEVLRS